MNSLLRIRVQLQVQELERLVAANNAFKALSRTMKNMGATSAKGAVGGLIAVSNADLTRMAEVVGAFTTMSGGARQAARTTDELSEDIQSMSTKAVAGFGRMQAAMDAWDSTAVKVQKRFQILGAQDPLQQFTPQKIAQINRAMSQFGRVENIGDHQKQVKATQGAIRTLNKNWSTYFKDKAAAEAEQAAAEERRIRNGVKTQTAAFRAQTKLWKTHWTIQREAEAEVIAQSQAMWQTHNTALKNLNRNFGSWYKVHKKIETAAEKKELQEREQAQREYYAAVAKLQTTMGRLQKVRDKSDMRDVVPDGAGGTRHVATTTAALRANFEAEQKKFDDILKDVNKANKAVDTAMKEVDDQQKRRAKAGFLGNLFGYDAKKSITNMGKNVQWIGRQIEFNFTLPIAAAGAIATKFWLDNERHMAKLKKVYGDAGNEVLEFDRDQAKLRETSMLLSNVYGVNQEEVTELMGRWAAAGLEADKLAKMTDLTMQAMVFGDFGSTEEAFESLISIQAAYGLSVEQLEVALSGLNTIENTTATQFDDLAVGVAKAGGAAATAGIPIENLSAMMAVLAPATGSAATAGNSLKTMISRLGAPTQDMVELLGLMGIAQEDFFGADGLGRVNMMADAWRGLSDEQRTLAASVAAGRYQFNKFDVLMDDIASGTGIYAQSLAETADKTQNVINKNNELAAYLQSDPARFDQLIQSIRNFMIEAITPIIPAIMGVIGKVRELAQWFANLSPEAQRIAILALAFLAVIGPVIRLTGAVLVLGGSIGKSIQGVIGIVVGLGKLFIGVAGSAGTAAAATEGVAVANTQVAATNLAVWATNPYVLLALSIVGAIAFIYIFRNEIIDSFRDIHGEWYDMLAGVFRGIQSLPRVVGEALLETARVVKNMVEGIREGLMGISPWVRHSPSLVEQVNSGVDAIQKKYKTLEGLGAVFRRAADDFERFKDATAGARALAKETERNEQRGLVMEFDPGSMGAVESLYGSIDALEAELLKLERLIKDQRAVVDPLRFAYEQWADAVEDAEQALSKLEARADAVQRELDAAQERLDNWANTPIEGSRAFSDALFENEMAQKRLRLEMMRLEDVVGPTEDVQNRLAALQGEIERLQGLTSDLRKAGAGSEVLGPINAQIDALEQQKNAIQEQAAPIQEMEDELARLEREAERLDLEQSLALDPLRRQIEQLTDTMVEMPFEQILAGITTEQAEVARLTAEYEIANQAVADQQTIVDSLTASRDAAEEALNVELEKLEELEQAYDTVEQQLRTLEGALQDYISDLNALKAAADAAKEELSNLAEQWGMLPDETDALPTAIDMGPPDQAAWDKWLEDMRKQMEDGLGEFDLGDIIGGWFDGLEEKVRGFVKRYIIDPFMRGLVELFQWVTNFPAKILWEAPRLWLNAIKWFIRELGDWLDPRESHSPSIEQRVKDGMIAVGLAFLSLPGLVLEGIISFVMTVVQWFIELPIKVLETMGGYGSLLYAKGIELLHGLIQGSVDKAVEFWNWLKGVKNEALSSFGEPVGWLLQKGKDLIQGAIDGLRERGEDLWTWLRGVNQKALETFGDPLKWLLQKGKDLIQGVINGVKEKVEDLWTWVRNFPTEVKNKMGSAVDWLKQHGRDAVEGFLEGARERLPGVDDVAWGIADALTFGTASRLRSNSPSLAMKEIGEDAVAGFRQGVESLDQPLADVGGNVLDHIEEMYGQWIYYSDLLAGKNQGTVLDVGKMDEAFSNWMADRAPQQRADDLADSWDRVAKMATEQVIPAMDGISEASTTKTIPSLHGIDEASRGVRDAMDQVYRSTYDSLKQYAEGQPTLEGWKKKQEEAAVAAETHARNAGFTADEVAEIGNNIRSLPPPTEVSVDLIGNALTKLVEILEKLTGIQATEFKASLTLTPTLADVGVSPELVGEIRTQLGLAPAAAKGAMVAKTAGGQLVWVGEGRTDEMILPLPPGLLQGLQIMAADARLNGMNRRTVDGGAYHDNRRTVNINGDLVLPNITNGEDADLFIRNLEALAVR